MGLGPAAEEFEEAGRVWLRGVLDTADLTPFDEVARTVVKPGARLALDELGEAAIGAASVLSTAVGRIVPGTRAVRAVVFNKTGRQNWGVPWHQDRLISVAARCDVPGYRNWSQKAGIWHCEAPVALLRQMAFVRVHLDDVTADNGPMEIALGSHRAGVVDAAGAGELAESCERETCLARRGDVLVLNMLTLHRSSHSASGTPRRAVRVDYGPDELQGTLVWAS